MSYQTFVVHVLAVASMFVALIAGNMEMLGINNPWVSLVLVPGMVGALFYAGNQMKTIGEAPVNTKKVTTETTTTPDSK